MRRLDFIFFTSPLVEWRMVMHVLSPPKQPGQPMTPAIHTWILIQLEGNMGADGVKGVMHSSRPLPATS
jgi:hypothetical protein